MRKKQIGMNICPQYIGLPTGWQQYILYKLVYGLHPLMPTKYVLSTISGDHINVEPTKVLITKISKQKKLHESRLEAQNNVGAN
jgi:hypothetical protein